MKELEKKKIHIKEYNVCYILNGGGESLYRFTNSWTVIDL